jgi:amino acid adenylation domain-containing protein
MFVELGEIQKGIYFECQAAESLAYNISSAVIIKNIDPKIFKKALQLIVSEQEMLRSNIVMHDGKLQYQILDECKLNFKYSAADNGNKETIDKLVRECFCYEFNLSEAPLYFCSLIQKDEEHQILSVCFHHLIADGVSIDIFIKRLLELCKKLENREHFILKNDNGYRRFLKKESNKLTKGKYDKQKEYWRKKLTNAEPLEISKEKNSAVSNRGVGKELRFEINSSLYNEIQRISKENDISPFMFGLGVFNLLMGAYSGKDDVVVASPFTYRPGYEQDNSIGCFIYTLPLRIKLDKELILKDLLTNTSEDVKESYINIGYPNNLIARDNYKLSSVGAPSLFDITYIFDSYEAQSDLIEGMYDVDFVTFPGEMMVIFQIVGNEACIKFQYKEENFSEEFISYMGNRYVHLLQEVVSKIENKVRDVDLFIENERDNILNKFNASNYFPYTPENIANIFEKKVKECGDRVGIIANNNTYSYRQINEMANKLARKIIAFKKGDNDAVGLQLRRSINMVVAILAIIKAGCAYVPMDANYPEERKRFIVDDADISLLITESTLPFPKDSVQNILYVDDKNCFEGEGGNLNIELSPSNLAYIEYTSGSTGKPKGVMIENQSVVNTALDLERRFPLKENDVYLLKTTYTFDIFGTELYGWIVGKGKLCILDADGEKNPELMLDVIQKYKVTHINFVPSMFRIFLEYLNNKENLKKIESIKWFFVGGEAITQDMVQKYFALSLKARLENVYGPTEATMWATNYHISGSSDFANIPIGKPLNEYRCYIVDSSLNLLPVGIPGELCISGVGLARGYLKRNDLTQEKFIKNPFFDKQKDPDWMKMLYRTGDLARWRPDGNLEFMGRIDFQVKIGGIRIELGEIENALCKYRDIIASVAVIKDSNKICAYYMSDVEYEASDLRKFLSDKLPAYMIPSFFIHRNDLPLNGSGKVNRKALMSDVSYLKERSQRIVEPGNDTEKLIAEIWQSVLNTRDIGIDDNFFDIGGNSLTLMQVHNRLQERLSRKIQINELLRFPTIRLLAEFLEQNTRDENKKTSFNISKKKISTEDIAIVGLTVDVPGADNIQDFWNILKEQKETIHFYSDEELKDIGVDESLIRSSNYVKAKGRVEDLDYFDNKFFDIPPREVNMTSPQLRLLYKGMWKVFEDAGYYPESVNGRVGVYIGGSDDFEWYRHALFNNKNFSDTYQSYTLSTNHFLATRLSHKFNLKGPSINVLTGCSTSLVTVHLACRSLLAGECDMAIAGGITVELPNDGGYMYEEGMMFSPDGHCRPFDANANGTVFSNGMALAALKRLDDAIRDKDNIYAVIKGSAINNDGNVKMSYTAPSEDGQVEVIREAYNNAGINPETVGYVEAHGTGTLLGDPIEVGSLTRAFATDKKQYCVLGSIKGNIGHTDTAAGIIGLAKVSLCLKNKYLPATVNYNVANPKIDFGSTPFIVKNSGQEWKRMGDGNIPLRAGINSFGVGGTNVHMVLEESQVPALPKAMNGKELLVFSAKSENALNNTMSNILSYIAENDISLSDAAWTLNIGRKHFKYRKSVFVDENFKNDVNQVIKDALAGAFSAVDHRNGKDVLFLFSGQGSQYQGMCKDLYFGDQRYWVCAEYKKWIDKLFDLLPQNEKKEFFDVIYGESDPKLINQTRYSQFALFTTEYALAQILISMGVEPAGLLGHSIGEITAAAVAGVWSLEDAVAIVRARGDYMQEQEPGTMLSVMEDEEVVKKYLNENLWISLLNTSHTCVVGGKKEDIANLSDKLDADNIIYIPIRTSHAFHTPMMKKAAEKFKLLLDKIKFKEPKYPIISNVTGEYAKKGEICSSEYWAKHILSCVQFEKDLDIALANDNCVGIELGPGNTLCSFAGQHVKSKKSQVFVNLIRHRKENENDISYFYKKIGKLWCENVSVNISKLDENIEKKRVSLPTYVFDEISFPINLDTLKNKSAADSTDEYLSNQSITEVHYEAIENMDRAKEIVADAYEEILGYHDFDPSADFFGLGGDSLKAASLVAVIKAKTGIDISVKDIFANANAEKLAAYVFAASGSSAAKTAIMPAKKADNYPLSASQKRMYTFYRMDPEGLSYNLPSATLIEGELNLEKVKKAVEKLIQRHESLRTSFASIDGKVVQIINDTAEVPFEYDEKKYEAEEDFNSIVKEFIRPFDLSKAPLFRIKLVKYNENRYILLFDVHHIIADGTAVEIITRDFNALYFGELEPIRIQYKDFAVWQNQYMKSDAMKSQEAFWLSHLSGELPVLELPTDFPRKEIPDFSGGRLTFNIPDELAFKIKSLAKKFGATNFMVMISAWYILLSRYSNQDDIIIGTPVSGRTNDDILETVGMFVNMLALRNFPSKDKKYGDFLDEVKYTTLEALKNQEYQFDTLVEHLNIKRKLNRNPVFDVSFDYHNMKLYDLDVEDLKFKSIEVPIESAPVDLLLTCNESNGQNLDCFIDYAASLFKKTTIQRMAEQYVEILKQITENQDIPIGKINILSHTDMDILQKQFSRTRLEIDDKVLVHELFEREAAKHPEKIALITADNKEYSYAYINEKANILANKLIDAGLENNDFVGIIPQRNEKLIIAMFAIMKAGGAYVAIDPKFPEDRIAYMLKTSKIGILICDESFAGKYDYNGKYIFFDTLNDRTGKIDKPQCKSNRDSNIYAIFTSGSTGLPKGVKVKHEGIVNLFYDHMNKKIFHNEDDRIICIATPSFDIFGFETIIPLCGGFSVYMANENEQLDSEMLAAKIEKFHVTHLQAPVSRLKAMVDNKSFQKILPQLRVIVGGGESYPKSLVKFLKGHTPAKLYNMYGPTETTITATVKELTSEENVNIGTPISNTQAFIVDEDNSLLPIGVFGELCIAGRGLSNGYIDRPEETSAKFTYLVLDEKTKKGVKIYKTGDRARILDNGEIELLGRMDNQVKIRGYRVELDEIEKTAMENENVSYAVSKIFTNENGNTQLGLFYTTSDGLENDEELKDHLKKKLPDYMVPSFIIHMSELPVLPNGKIDRKALKIPRTISKENKDSGNKPNTYIERKIMDIWKEVLNLDSVSVNDNFFDIGGNSYSLMLVNNRINTLLNKTVPLMQLFENPTIASLIKSFNLNSDSQLLEKENVGVVTHNRDVAVIGMSGRFPGAPDIETLWDNLLKGKESITAFSKEELKASGISEDELNDPNYVNAKGFLDDVEYFDAKFFNYSVKEANSMDPQIRLLHMCVWNALEDAGYNSLDYNGKIGLFAGSSSNVIWMTKFLGKQNDSLGAFEALTMNDKDFITTKVSYKLNLKGPSINVQTACSTSLVAIHQAVKYLQNGEADIAVAGGVSVSYPRKEGYLWHQGMIYSKDGHCRPFSMGSSGTVPGNGCGAVVLKLLDRAVADNDHIYAVIKGSAINNDGLDKIGYTAPSIAGQRNVIEKALSESGVKPSDIDFIETHGTGTELGDPIEIEALNQALGMSDKKHCALGAIKANIGHLDAAAGVAGFIKAVEILQHKKIPPLINFKGINSRINIENSRFYINTEPVPIESDVAHGAVSAFGIGGTNAHVILEESTYKQVSDTAAPVNILPFSAKSREALIKTYENVADYLKENSPVNMSDVSYTLMNGRGMFDYRKACIVTGNNFNKGSLLSVDGDNGISLAGKSVIFVFPKTADRFFVFDNQVTKSADKMSELFIAGVDSVLGLLDYSISKKIKSMLTSGEYGNRTEENLLNFAVLYAISKTVMCMGISPEKICGGGLAGLCDRVINDNLPLEDAVTIILDNNDGSFEALEGADRGVMVNADEGDNAVTEPENTIFVTFGESGFTGKKTTSAHLPLLQNGEITAVALNKMIAELWVSGFDVKWSIVHADKRRARMSLPGYVFDKIAYDSDVVIGEIPAADTKEQSFKGQNLTDEEISDILSDIWFKVLGQKKESDSDDFFKLGGESLSAVLMTSMIHKKTGINIPVSEVFKNTQYGQLLRWLCENKNVHEENNDASVIERVGKKDYYETSPAQKRMYAVSQLIGDKLSYNLASVYYAEGVLDKEKLVQVFSTLCKRHDAFRTSFGMVDGDVVQYVCDEVQPFVEFIEASEETAGDAIKSFIRPFDLSKAPLIRIGFISIDANRHYIIIDMHHIISDQTSIAILMNEFSLLYEGKELPEINTRYIDYATWQNKLLKTGQIRKQVDYWKNEFKDGIPALDFPTDYPRTHENSHKGKVVRFDLDADLCQEINDFTNGIHITPYMLMMAALNIMLWKYTAQDDIVVGTAVAGRRNASLKNIVGMFVNILPIRSQIDENLNVSEYLQYVKQKMVAAFECQDCQFDTLLEELNVDTSTQNNPFFDIILNYVNMGTEELSIEGLKLTPHVSDEVDTKYDMTITVVESDKKYHIDIEFSIDLFKQESIQAFGERFIRLTQFIINNDRLPLKKVTILSEKDRRLIDSLNKTYAEAPLEKDVISIFEDNVRLYRNQPALIWNDENYTYGQLDDMANNLACLIQKSGVKHQDKVGILLKRGPIQIAAILAVLKCGAVYVPMDCEYPIDRINFMLNDCKASLLITHRACTGEELEFKNLLFIDDIEQLKNAKTEVNTFERPSGLCGEDEAYIIYTSGSTGKPKGVLIRHKSVIRTSINTNYLPIKPAQRVLQLANYTFDASVYDIFGALLNGACLVMVPREIATEMPLLANIIKTSHISHALIVTAIFNMLVDYDVTVLKYIDRIYIGGEALSISHMRKALACVGKGHLINLYGPTESTVLATKYDIDSIEDDWTSIPIGWAASNTSLYIIDPYGNVLPPKVPGELCIGGVGLAKGYLGRDELTKSKFFKLESYSNERVYRSGDRVVMDFDGKIFFLGRLDNQIKLRGYRIELGEVEGRIAAIKGIKDAVAVARQDNIGSMYIAGYYTIESEEYLYITPDYIREVLQKQVPDYMVPSRIQRLDKLPITANGKVNRKALPIINEQKTAAVDDGGARNEAERVILKVMREVLDNPSVGVNDNFFKNGGQSIKAIVLVQRLKNMGIELMVNDIFKSPTVRELASKEQVAKVYDVSNTEEESNSADDIPEIPLDEAQIDYLADDILKSSQLLTYAVMRGPVVKEFEMSAVQEAHMGIETNSSGFSISLSNIKNPSDIKLRIANSIIKHQLLHSSVKFGDRLGWCEHNVEKNVYVLMQSVPYFDLSCYKKESREKLVSKIFSLFMNTKYERESLLWRLCVLKLSSDSVQVIWCFNHSCFDGMSAEILKRELTSADLNSDDKSIDKYDSYANLLKLGPAKDENWICDKFNLNVWSDTNGKIMRKLSEPLSDANCELIFKFPIDPQCKDVCTHTYQLILEILRKYFCCDEIPMAIVNYGRKYADTEFYNCIGEFLDVIPIVFGGKDADIESSISNAVRLSEKYSINFLTLINSADFINRYDGLKNMIGKYLDVRKHCLDVILFNFQGYISEKEINLFNDAQAEESGGESLARLQISANYNEESINIAFESNGGIEAEQLKRIAEEKGGKCTREEGTKK